MPFFGPWIDTNLSNCTARVCTGDTSLVGSHGTRTKGLLSLLHPEMSICLLFFPSLPPALKPLAFPSASVIRCKRGCCTKVTWLSPKMGIRKLTCVHTTLMPSLLLTVHWHWCESWDQMLSPKAGRAWKDVSLSLAQAHKSCTDCDLERLSYQTYDRTYSWHTQRKVCPFDASKASLTREKHKQNG